GEHRNVSGNGYLQSRDRFQYGIGYQTDRSVGGGVPSFTGVTGCGHQNKWLYECLWPTFHFSDWISGYDHADRQKSSTGVSGSFGWQKFWEWRRSLCG